MRFHNVDYSLVQKMIADMAVNFPNADIEVCVK